MNELPPEPPVACPIGLDKKNASQFCSAGYCTTCKERRRAENVEAARQLLAMTPAAREALSQQVNKEFKLSPLMTFAPHIPAPAQSKNRCTHPNLPKVVFDLKDAQSMKTAGEIRQKYPRLYLVCPDCREGALHYASMDHYILGDW